MKVDKITLIELSILLLVCLIPIFWFRSGFFYANGDDYPLFLNPQQTYLTGTSLWSTNYLGYATPMPAYLLYQNLGAFFSSLGLTTGSIQTIFLVSLFTVAGFSMFYLTRKIYPASKVSPFIASLFYMLNFFFLINLRNIGFRWTYAFLPLILALFFNIMNSTFQGDKRSTNKNILYFALASIVAFSFASINPANISLFIIGFSVMAIYFLYRFRSKMRPFFISLGKTVGVTFIVNLWWLIPVLNSFIFSGQSLNSQVSIDSWSWTQARASFLNLFWLNGSWNWSAEYFPYINSYTNSILTILVFVPFLLATSALLFKSNKTRFNAFLMAVILFFLFMAKGLHEPFGQLNLLFYDYIPLMSMFREPVSKFSIVMLPFLALLVGFGSEKLAGIKLGKINVHFSKAVVTLFLVIILAVSVFPILLDSMETKTSELPFSSQVKVPDYWHQATDWINAQTGDWKVLLTPLDDFYQMPYIWGYYGSDQLLERFFEKPIVSTAALNGYVSNPNASDALKQIRTAVKFNRTDEFKALLDLLSIKYIVQRNDVVVMVGRNLESTSEMKVFFAEQPYLILVKSFGKLDIYEYTEAKPSMYTLLTSTLQKTDIRIYTSTSLNKTWSFSLKNDVEAWKNTTASNQSQATCLIISKNNQLEADMSNLTSGWITVNSPLLQADIESSYSITANFSAKNDLKVNLKIAEYSENMTLLTYTSIAEVEYDHGTYENWFVPYTFEPENENTKYFQIQFWNYFNSVETSQSSLLLNNIQVYGTVSTLNMTGLENIYVETPGNPEVLSVQNDSPTKIVASVNTTRSFILATSQELDKFWVAYVNGQQVQPVSLYLGLGGFLVNATGQFTVTLEYEPQQWFNYGLAISGVTVVLLCAMLVYLNRNKIKLFINVKSKSSGNNT